MADEGHSFGEVVGSVLATDLQGEMQRVEADRKAREALRKLRDAAEKRKTMSASDLIASTMGEGAKVAEELAVPRPKASQTDAPSRPAAAPFPPPPTGR